MPGTHQPVLGSRVVYFKFAQVYFILLAFQIIIYGILTYFFVKLPSLGVITFNSLFKITDLNTFNIHFNYNILFIYLVFLPRQGFSVALEPVLELALVNQADLELSEIRLPLPP